MRDRRAVRWKTMRWLLQLLQVVLLALLGSSLIGCNTEWQQHRYKLWDDPNACKWPECAMHCDPCPEKRVGDCTLKLLGADLRYQCNTNKTECVVGRCVCKKGFCAGAYTQEGLRQADPSRLRSCDPQVCYKGARPPPDNPSLYVQFLAWLAPPAAARFAMHLQKDYLQFLMYCSMAPAALLATGVGIALALWLCLCSGHGCCRGSCGFKLKLYIFGRKAVPCDCMDLSSDEAGLDLDGLSLRELKEARPKVTPSVFPLLRTTLGIATCCALVVTLRQFNSHAFVVELHDTLDHISADVQVLGVQAEVINSTVGDVARIVQKIQSTCWVTDPIVVALTKDVNTMLPQTAAQINEGTTLLLQVPSLLQALGESLKYVEPFIVWIPVIPQILIGLSCIVLALPSMLVFTCRQGKCIAHVFDLFLLWMSMFTVIITICITAVASAELVFGVAGSTICLDIDRYVMHYARLYGAPAALSKIAHLNLPVPTLLNPIGGDARLVIHTVRHYIRGDVPNPIPEILDSAVMQLDQAVSLYEALSMIRFTVGMSCPPLFELDVVKVVDLAKNLISDAKRLTAAANVWPYYNTLVQEMTCHKVMNSTGVMLTSQVVICLVLFPLALLRTHHFLLRKEEYIAERSMIKDAIWMARQEAKQSRRRAKSTSSGSESDSSSG